MGTGALSKQPATMHRMQRCRGLYFFQMSQNRVLIRPVFEGEKIGLYEVCIFVNMGLCEKTAALYIVAFTLLLLIFD